MATVVTITTTISEVAMEPSKDAPQEVAPPDVAITVSNDETRATPPPLKSEATFTEYGQSIESSSKRLTSNAEEIHRFLSTHTSKNPPRGHLLTIKQEMYQTDSDTSLKRWCTDWKVEISLDDFVVADGTGSLSSLPRSGPTLDEEIQRFARSFNRLKQLRCKKKVEGFDKAWKERIIAAARECTRKTLQIESDKRYGPLVAGGDAGGGLRLEFSVKLKEEVVTINSSTRLAGFVNHPLTAILCLLSCLWIIALPLVCALRESVELVSTFPATALAESPEDWMTKYFSERIEREVKVDNSRPALKVL
eukprot:4539716-Prymnesium_polylepis.1